MHKKVAKLDRDFHKFLALLGLMSEHYGHRHRSKMLTKHPLPHVSGARAARRPTRPAMGGARAKSYGERPLRVLNRRTGAPGVGDVSTPSNSNRAGRPQKEVHGAVRTRLTSERLRNSEKTTSSIHLGPLTSLCKAPRRVQERQGQHLSDEDRVAFAKRMCPSSWALWE